MPVSFHPNKPIVALERLIVKDDGSPLQGEIDIYRKLYEDLDASDITWDVWHNLRLPEHSEAFNYYHKTSAQIDFLILSKHGILVLEVKGGYISLKGNQFYYGKNFDSEMKQNPFEQAEGYKHTIKDKILDNFKSCFFCEAVAFPHVNYSFKSKIFDNTLLWTEYTSSTFNNSIECFLLNVYRYTKEKHKRHFRTYTDLTANEIIAVKKILSPIIEDKSGLNEIDTLNWLRIQNIEILEGLYKNPRIMLEGPPGSGKTTMAKAFIDMQLGKSGIYLCWNNLLMHYTNGLLKTRIDHCNVEVTTFFRFFQKYNTHLSYENLISLKEEQFYNLVKETIARLENQNKIKPYDFIVIDEGQDIFDRGLDMFVEKFSGLGGHGLVNGKALILYDIDQSYASSGRNVWNLSDILTQYFAHFKLNEVKRSAQNPDIRNLSLAFLEEPKILNQTNLNIEYPKIKLNRFRNLTEVKNHLVKNLLGSIRTHNSSLKGENCIVLVESSLLKGNYKGHPDMNYQLIIKDVEELTEHNIMDNSNRLRYTSILRYKGLEKMNVYLVITEPTEDNKYEIYVGMTRAMLNLEINVVD